MHVLTTLLHRHSTKPPSMRQRLLENRYSSNVIYNAKRRKPQNCAPVICPCDFQSEGAFENNSATLVPAEKHMRTSGESVPWRRDGPQAFARHNSFSFLHCVEVIGRKIRQGLGLARGPENVYAVQPFVGTETEVDSEIILRQITSTTAHFIYLN